MKSIIPIQILFSILIFFIFEINALHIPKTSYNKINKVQSKRQLLSTSKRLLPIKRFGYFSFSRNPKTLPFWNPLEGIEGILIHHSIKGYKPKKRDLKLGFELKSIQDESFEKEESNGGIEEEYEIEERDDDNNELNCEDQQQDHLTTGLSSQFSDSIPSKEVKMAQTQLQLINYPDQLNNISNINITNIVDKQSNVNITDFSNRKYSDKILWSGFDNYQQLEERNLYKRHSDKSGSQEGYDDDSGGGRENNGGKKGSIESEGGNDNSDSNKHGGYGNKGNEDQWQDEGSKGDSGGKDNQGWKDTHNSHNGNGANHQSGYTNGKGTPGRHKSMSDDTSTSDDNYHEKFQQDWDASSSSSTNDKWDHEWDHEANSSGNSGDHDQDDNSNDDRGDPKHKYDDGQYHSANNDSESKGNNNWDDGQYHHSSTNEDDTNENGNWDQGGYHHWSDSQSQSQPNSQSTYDSKNDHQSDCSNLAKFYKSFEQSWIDDKGWSNDEILDCCQWSGVTCGSITKRVMGLNLRNNGLKGDLDNSLFDINGLMRIDLSGNDFKEVPDKFDGFTKLTHLNISNSNIIGRFPSSLRISPNLVNLDLSNNKLNGFIQFHHSTSLKSINLSNNQLTSFSIDIDSMDNNLNKIDFRNNQMSGPLPDLSGLKSLTSFDISNNNTGPLFDISNLTNLTRFDVRNNQLTGSFPILPSSIQSIFLSSNQFTGQIPSTIQSPENLINCYILPNNFICPTKDQINNINNNNSLFSKCHLHSCFSTNTKTIINNDQHNQNGTGTGTTTIINASQITSLNVPNGQKGIPVNPLPGENLTVPQNQLGQSKDQVVVAGQDYPGLSPQSQSQTQRLGSKTQLSSDGLQTMDVISSVVRIPGLIVFCGFIFWNF
ncbi:uncharacterized protein I206_104700 [Kwoniella pini CBS 10737]|uniref:Leucine-rich repeat-containing N-terminal plant-type domain-containing protein n=1 Tax=Kwoniella pini CBS 10737 TaxID=1296096 RepID=A0A1B9I7M7_9TREE|nr:uncharacterized protein I206_02238 [Kwoniella pini CBS 10737]OCF51524.1 hypothetical protein I206_02238 [Kwoniella pini CBS 10737]